MSATGPAWPDPPGGDAAAGLEQEGFECLGELTAIAAIPAREERHRALSDLLTGHRFLQLISKFGYWRGNLFVVRGSDRAGSHPIYWHWRRDPWTGELHCLLDDPREARVALPFVALDGPLRPVSSGERQAVEKELLHQLYGDAQDIRWPTSTRLIYRMRASAGKDRFVQEVGWGEILYGLTRRDGRFPPAGLEPTEDLVEAMLKHKPELRAFDPGIGAGPSARARAIDGRLAAWADGDGEGARFSVHTPRIERVRHIVGFLADSVYIEREEHSVYCLLELTDALDRGKRQELMSIFGKVASVGTLSDSLSDQAVRQARVYLHGFSKPMRDLGWWVKEAGREADASRRADLLDLALQQIDQIHAQAESALESNASPGRFRLRADVLEQLAGFVNRRYDRPVIELAGDEVELAQVEIYLKCLLINAIANAVEANPFGHVVRIAWGVGVTPQDLVRERLPDTSSPRIGGAAEMGEVLLLIAVHNFCQGEIGAGSVGAMVIDTMARKLGGSVHRDNVADGEFLLMIRMPTHLTGG